MKTTPLTKLLALLLVAAFPLAPRASSAADNLLPVDKLKPFEATFDGDKIAKGAGPTFPWRVSKFQKDKPGFVSLGTLPDGSGEGFTLWTEAKYGPNLWVNPFPLTVGVYRFSFEAKTAPETSWKLLTRLVDLADPSLTVPGAQPATAETKPEKGDGTLYRFDANPEWKTVAIEWTLLAETKWNFDFSSLSPGGASKPLFLKNLRLEKIAAVDPATAAAAQAKARDARLARETADFYGTLTGSVVSASPEKLVLKVTSAYPYTPFADPAVLVGQTVTVPVTPEKFTGSERDVRNLLGTTPRRDHALTFFGSVKPGQTVELGVYELKNGEAKLSRLPGPTTLAPNAPLPPYFGARVDEAAVKTTVHVAAANGNDANDGSTEALAVSTLERGLALAKTRLDAGEGVRVRVTPGVYRPRDTLRLTDYSDRPKSKLAPLSDKAKNATLIIEGTKPDGVFIRGSVTAGFEPGTWQVVDAAKGIYRHDWTPNFGTLSRGYYKPTAVLAHRRELLALNGKLLDQVLLEDFNWVDPSGTTFNEEIGLATGTGAKPVGKTGYIYKGWRDPVATLQPGQFGVAEMGPGEKEYDNHPHPNSLFLRLPEGVKTLEGALVEVGMLQTLLRVENKHNFVLRNLTFEHSANFCNDYYEKSAIDTNVWESFSDSQDWRWENVTVRANRGGGASLFWVRNVTLTNCRFVDNGALGIRPSFVREFVMEDCQVDRNNWLARQANIAIHGTGGLDFTGMNSVFRRCTFNENFRRAFRSDYGLEDVLLEDCEVARNGPDGGVFHEIEFGPVLWRNCRITDNGGKRGFGLLNVNRVTLENCLLSGNHGDQIAFYISPPRRRAGEMLPLGWFKFATHYAGDPVNHEMPRGDIRAFTMRGCTLVGTRGADNYLVSRYFQEGAAPLYPGFIRGPEFTADNNVYWNADATKVFEIGGNGNTREFTDLAGWQQLTGEDKGSRWQKP